MIKVITNGRLTGLTIRGVTRSLKEWAGDYGISVMTLRGRLNLGWSVRDALTTPVRRYGERQPKFRF